MSYHDDISHRYFMIYHVDISRDITLTYHQISRLNITICLTRQEFLYNCQKNMPYTKTKPKHKNTKFLFKKKLNWRSDFTYQISSRYGMYGTWSKKIPKFSTKIPIFTFSTRVHLDSTPNHSKSWRGLIFMDSVQFWGQTDIIWQS